MFDFLRVYFPVAVLTAVVLVIVFTEIFKTWVEKLKAVAEKKGKKIKIFDFAKIWLAVFNAVIISVALVLAGFLEWRQLWVYTPAILGLSIFLYETILKKLKKLQNDEN